MSDLITFSSSILQGPTRVVGFRGVEAISRPYRFEIFLSVPSEGEDDTDFAEMVGAKARLSIDRQDDTNPPYVFTGVLAGVDLVHEFGGRALLRAVLVPRLWGLTLSKHSRIFTKKTVPDVIKLVLEENGITGSDVELNLGSYETEEHICQYRESDFDFVSRWMEREGIFYYFEHTEDGEKLVLCDDKSYPAGPLGAPVRYHPQTGEDRSASASFRTFSCQHGALPSRVKLKDYDYVRPHFPLAGSAPVSQYGTGEISLHGERFFSADAGKRLAQLRAEEYLAREAVYQATGARLHLRSGYTFELEDHPRARFNTKYLAVELRHHGNQSAGHGDFEELAGLTHEEVYFVEVAAIPASTQFRAESRTPWPRIYGYENGTVDGSAASEYAQIDEHGRYLVKLKFDEASPRDGSGSTYVRMMQPHGGGVEGFHFPLRRGTEVLLSFLGGDPDRPVISGVVPNVLTPSPVTSGNHTKNVIQTGGRNRLELEDQAGAQRITLSTPYSNTYLRMGAPNDSHELIAKTDANSVWDSGSNFDVNVGKQGGGNWSVNVRDHVTMDIEAGNYMAKANAGGMEFYAAQKVTWESAGEGKAILGDKTDLIKGNHTVLRMGEFLVWTGGTVTTATYGDSTTYTVGNVKTVNYSNTEETKQGNFKSVVHGNTNDEKHGNFKTTTKGSVVSQTVGSTVDTKLGMFISVAAGFVFDMKATANINMSLGGAFELKAAWNMETTLGFKLTVNAAGSNENTLGTKVSTNAGVTLDMKYGTTVTAKAGAELVMENARLIKRNVTIESLPTSIRSRALSLQKSGFTVI
ncbi:type VI secretion system tip protein TssI/VgrG [Sorangium sp. So ce834]|uniref:type VI secretion system Vgr family protein n=1 Tax=Sorangium sp. So ce834 TaxID=3133321 RepID=UPI003F5EED69